MKIITRLLTKNLTKKRIIIRGRMEQQRQFGLLVRETKIEAGDLDVI